MSAFTGTLRLARLALRRDRVQLPLWLAGITLVLWANAASIPEFYRTGTELAAQASIEASNIVSLVFNGPALGATLGAVTLVESSFLLIVLVPLMTAMLVVRHTRQNEETGRAEMLGATVVGRHATLTAALLMAVATNVVLGLLLAATLIGADLPTSGALAAGASIAALGIAFAGIAAVTAQVSGSARGANGIATAVLAGAFVLRAIGDAIGHPAASGVEAVSGWPSWLSPLGWAHQVRPFDDNRWWVLLLPTALFLLLVGVAYVLTSHRDVGTGMLPVRPGPATAPRALLSPLGLAWRLQRGVLAGWAVGVGLMGVAMGVITDEADQILGASEQVEEVIAQIGGPGGLTDSFLAAMVRLFGIGIAGYAVQALLRARAEEASGHVEVVLAGSVSRSRWLLGHVTCAVLGTGALLLLAGLTTGLGYALVSGEGGRIGPIVGAALAQAPATLALAGFVVLAVVAVPRLASALAWAALAFCLVLGQIGELLDLPRAVMDLSPFTHAPAAPAEDVTAGPLVALGAVALALTAVSVALFRRRDLTAQ